jgi:hypothetical protein
MVAQLHTHTHALTHTHTHTHTHTLTHTHASTFKPGYLQYPIYILRLAADLVSVLQEPRSNPKAGGRRTALRSLQPPVSETYYQCTLCYRQRGGAQDPEGETQPPGSCCC